MAPAPPPPALPEVTRVGRLRLGELARRSARIALLILLLLVDESTSMLLNNDSALPCDEPALGRMPRL